MSDVTPSPETLFARLIEELETDPHLDVEAYLRGNEAHATVLRARLEKLRRAGLLTASPSARSVLHAMRERFGLAGTIAPAPASSEDPDSKGELLPSRVVGGRYRILSEIGRGGMGRVFRALDIDLEREVALKVVELGVGPDTPQGRAYLERFLTEAKVTAQLEHPSIVPLHDIGLDRAGQLYYTMKLVEGRTLEAQIEHWRAAGAALQIQELLRIVLQICDALALAHERGVLHRDLKPSNVMIGRFGEVHVMDWGLAKVLGSAEPAPGEASSAPQRPNSPTLAGDVIGTPSHMAPEQAKGRVVDRRTDVYGVGAILHHALVGVPPNSAAPGRPHARAPRELLAICARALQSEPDQRYSTVPALVDDVRAFLDDRRGSSWRDGLLQRTTKWTRRHPARATSWGAGVVLALAISTSLLFLRSANERAARERERSTVVKLGELIAKSNWDAEAFALDDAEQVPHFTQARLAAFREAGFALDGLEPLSDLLERIDGVRSFDPRLHTMLVEEIEDLVSKTSRAQLESVRRFCAGTLTRKIERKRALWQGWCAEYPALLDSLPRLWELLYALESDPWRVRILQEYRQHFEELATWPAETVAETPAAPRDKVFLAMCLAGTGREENVRAIDLLHGAGAEIEDSYWAQLVLGSLEGGSTKGREDLTHATEHSFKAVALNPRSFRAWSNLGAALTTSRRHEIALFAFERAVEIDPDDEASRRNLVTCLTNLGTAAGDRAEAHRLEAERITRLNGIQRGREEKAAENLKREGLVLFQRALALDPNYLAALINLGNAEDDPAEKEKHFLAALALEPCSLPALWSYADLLHASGRHAERVERMAALHACQPERADVTAFLAMARHEWGSQLLGEGDAERGREQLEEAACGYAETVRLDPDDLYAEQNLGLALAELGRGAEAVAHLERSLARREQDLTSPEPKLPPEEHAKRIGELLTRHPLLPAATAHWEEGPRARMDELRERARELFDFSSKK